MQDNNQKNIDFSQRLLQLIESHNYTIGRVEKALSWGQGTLHKAINKGQKLGIDKVREIIDLFPSTDITWLITGQKSKESDNNHNVVNEPAPVYEKIPADLQRKVNFLMEQVQDMSKTLYEVGQKTEKHEEQLKRLTGR